MIDTHFIVLWFAMVIVLSIAMILMLGLYKDYLK